MNKKLLILPLFCSLLTAQTVKTKEMKAKDYEKHYDQSSSRHTTENRVISSSAEASAQITVMLTIQTSSEMTSGRHSRSMATMSFLDNNRINITKEIAQGEGEYLETLLSMMNLKKDTKSLMNIQSHFDELIYLSHSDFLDKLDTLA
jgi:short subunit fatty acids transporter